MARVSFTFSFVFFFLLGCAGTPKTGDPNYLPITILHTNDVHGHAWPEADADGVMRGGFAAQAALIKKIRKEVDAKNGVVLVLSGGDCNTGTPDSDLLDAEPDITAMNMIGYDAMVLGNHEFDRGIDKILKQRKWVKFPFLSSNVRYEKGNQYLVDPYTVLVRKDVNFGILGLSPGDLRTLVVGKLMDGMIIEDPVKAAKAHLPKLKEMGADILIGLTHIGYIEPGSAPHQTTTTDDSALAQAVPEIAIIVGGHTHTLIPKGVKVNKTVISQAGSHGKHLGRIDLLWNIKDKEIASWDINMLPVLPSEGEDPDVKAKLDAFKKKTHKMLDEVIASAEVPLEGDRTQVRSRETNLANLVTDVIRKSTKADVAVFNGGGIRSGVAKGPIRMRDIYSMLPFQNTVVTAKITGAQLKEAVQIGIENSFPGGGLLQVSGFSYKVDNGKVTEMSREGKPIGPDETFLFATNNFLLEGGNNMTVLKTLPERRDTGIQVDRMLIEFLKKAKKVSPKKENRIEFLTKLPPRPETTG